MTRVLHYVAVLAFAALSLGGVATSAAASSTARSDANNFVFESFEGDYYLGIDDGGRSTLRTVEKYVAIMSEANETRGILRAIVDDYDDHPTDIDIVSVTDENGDPRDWHFADDDEGSGDDRFTEIVIRDDNPGVYVHGRQTYVITYDQHNVTRYFGDTGVEEFYWDTNGTGWPQPFGSVTARVHVSGELTASLTDDVACYFGVGGSRDLCDVARSEGDDGGAVFTSTVHNLTAGENLTVAIGFDRGAFVPRDDRYLASPLGWLQLAAIAGAVALAVWAVFRRFTTLRDGRGRPTIIAEYVPPKDVGVLTSAVVIGKTTRAAAGMFVELAVNRNIRIIEAKSTSWFSRKPTYTLELVRSDGVSDQQWQLLSALFGFGLVPGTQYTMKSKDVTLSKQVLSIVTLARKRAVTDGWRKRIPAATQVLPTILVILAALGSFILGVLLLEQAYGGGRPLLLVIPVLVCVAIVFLTVFRVPLTENGSEVRDHLKGLELYIRLAEADRLRVLQSPEGAEREPVSTSDPRQVLDIYEKLLPYAVLFSLEKRWAKELGKYYTDASPDWYAGSGAFNAATFASSIGSLSASAASSYSGSSSSSSSGGSGGGGSSGGGGGGGGGGGV